MSPAAVVEPPASDVVSVKALSQIDNSTTHKLIKTPLPNPSLQVTADHNLKQEEAPVYAPATGEVLLHIKATGVCGSVVAAMIMIHANCLCRSDIHFWRHGRIGSLVVEGDCILGHEAAGVVLQCGEGVTNLKPGSSQYSSALQIFNYTV